MGCSSCHLSLDCRLTVGSPSVHSAIWLHPDIAFTSPTLSPLSKPVTSSHVLCDAQRTRNTFRDGDRLLLCKDNLCCYVSKAWWVIWFLYQQAFAFCESRTLRDSIGLIASERAQYLSSHPIVV